MLSSSANGLQGASYQGNNLVHNFGLYNGDVSSGVPQHMAPSASGGGRSFLFRDNQNSNPLGFGLSSTITRPGKEFREQMDVFPTAGSNNPAPGGAFAVNPYTSVIKVLDTVGVRGCKGLVGEIFMRVNTGHAYTTNTHVLVRTIEGPIADEVPDMGTATTFGDSESMFSIGVSQVGKSKQFGAYWSMEAASAEYLAQYSQQFWSSFELAILQACYNALLAVYTPERCIAEQGVTMDPVVCTVSPADFVRMRRHEASVFGLVNKDPNNAIREMIRIGNQIMARSACRTTHLMVGEALYEARTGAAPPPVSEVGEERAAQIHQDKNVLEIDAAARNVKIAMVPRNFVGPTREAYDAFLKTVSIGKFTTTPCWRTIQQLGVSYTKNSANPTIVDYDSDSFVQLLHSEAVLNSGVLAAGANVQDRTDMGRMYLQSIPGYDEAKSTIEWYYQQAKIPSVALSILNAKLGAALASVPGTPASSAAFFALNVLHLFTTAMFEWFENNNIPFPLTVVCARFGIQLSTQNVLAIDATTPIGVLHTSDVGHFVSRSIHMYATINCRMKLGAGVYKPQAIGMIPNPFICGYHGGGNTLFLDNRPANPVKSSDPSRFFDAHTLPVPVTFDQLAEIQATRCFTLVLPGFSSSEPLIEQQVTTPTGGVTHPKFMPSTAMCDHLIKRYFSGGDFSHPISYILGGLGPQIYKNNLTALQGLQKSPPIVNFSQDAGDRFTPCAHFGYCEFPDVMTRLVQNKSLTKAV